MRKRICAYPKLDGKITELFGTRSCFASALGISENSVSSKMQGKSKWKEREIVKACELLKLPKSEIPIYFF
jgi:hypothetical protein